MRDFILLTAQFNDCDDNEMPHRAVIFKEFIEAIEEDRHPRNKGCYIRMKNNTYLYSPMSFEDVVIQLNK